LRRSGETPVLALAFAVAFAFPHHNPHPKPMDATAKIAALTEILAHSPEEAFARYGLAMAYAAEGRQREALAEFDRILHYTPDYVPAYQMSAQQLLKAGNTEAARTRLLAGLLAAERTHNPHAASEMQAMLDDLG